MTEYKVNDEIASGIGYSIYGSDLTSSAWLSEYEATQLAEDAFSISDPTHGFDVNEHNERSEEAA